MRTISITVFPRPDRPRRRPRAGSGPLIRRRPVPVSGLGDAVERVARPIAQRVDRWTRHLPSRYRTRLAGCSACSRRRRALNLLVPDLRRWPHWRTAWRRLLPAWRAAFSRPAQPVQAAGKRAA